MSTSRMTTVWCDGLDGDGSKHALGCPVWSGEGMDAREARKASWFTQEGRLDFSDECLAARRER